MEKIMLVLDPRHVNMQAIDLGCYLACLTHSELTGVFIDDRADPDKRQPMGLGFGGSDGPSQGIVNSVNWTTVEGKPRAGGAAVLQQCCERKGARVQVLQEGLAGARDILAASRFADMLVIDAGTVLDGETGVMPTQFVKEVLEHSECPVILAPFSFQGISEIIFTYDGSGSSVHAIKQFTYLFPSWRDKAVVLLEVNQPGDKVMIQQHKMKEWLGAHYDHVETAILTGDASAELFGYLIEKKDAIVVMGAYGRNWLSRLFKPSHAGMIVKAVNLPVFISHQ